MAVIRLFKEEITSLWTVFLDPVISNWWCGGVGMLQTWNFMGGEDLFPDGIHQYFLCLSMQISIIIFSEVVIKAD